MDRVEFTRNMKTENPLEEIMRDHFTELMIGYDVAGGGNDCTVYGVFNQEDSTFTIIDVAKTIAEDICKKVDGSVIHKYNRKYKCIAQHKDNTLSITLKE